MPKRIAVFCDGTWNSPDIPQPTHVHRLWRATLEHDGQIAAYFPGVGTSSRMRTWAENKIHQVGGGAFGWGLNHNIRIAYQFIAERYAAGDELYIFGFSRGAYTARSLAGMIRKCGIAADPGDDTVRKAFDLYRLPGAENHPDKPHILETRRQVSPDFATSQKDLDWRSDHSQLVNIAYLGIWDTVGALGMPPSVLGSAARIWNRRYRFHDLELSSLVSSARHAVSLDEKRKFFAMTGWDNLDKRTDPDTNQAKPGLNDGDTSDSRLYQQQWFVGDHGMVGGSGVNRGLTNVTLDWITAGAETAGEDGLRLSRAILFDAPPDALSDGPIANWPRTAYKILPGLVGARPSPSEPWEVHPSLPARISGRPDYHPDNLDPRFLP